MSASPLPTSKEETLLKALKYLARHYVGVLEHGRDRIIALGGTCDPVDVMERGDPHLRQVREVIASVEGSPSETKKNPPHWTCRTHGDFDAMRAVGCPECMRLAREALKKIARGNVRTCPEILDGIQTGKLHHCTDYAAIEIAVGALASEESVEETEPQPSVEGTIYTESVECSNCHSRTSVKSVAPFRVLSIECPHCGQQTLAKQVNMGAQKASAPLYGGKVRLSCGCIDICTNQRDHKPLAQNGKGD